MAIVPQSLPLPPGWVVPRMAQYGPFVAPSYGPQMLAPVPTASLIQDESQVTSPTAATAAPTTAAPADDGNVVATEETTDDDGISYYESDQFFYALIGMQVWLFLTLVTACFYKASKPFPPIPGTPAPGVQGRQPPVLDGEWRNHIFQCLHVPQMCLFTCCCGTVRWADTMRMAHLLPFWGAFSLLCFFDVAGLLGMGASGLFMLMILVYFRQQIRKMFNIQPWTCRTVCVDCLSYMFCSLCAMVQEARQLEEAWAFGHPSVTGGNMGGQQQAMA